MDSSELSGSKGKYQQNILLPIRTSVIKPQCSCMSLYGLLTEKLDRFGKNVKAPIFQNIILTFKYH